MTGRSVTRRRTVDGASRARRRTAETARTPAGAGVLGGRRV